MFFIVFSKPQQPARPLPFFQVLKHLRDSDGVLGEFKQSGFSTDTIRCLEDHLWTDGKMNVVLRKVKQTSLQDQENHVMGVVFAFSTQDASFTPSLEILMHFDELLIE